LYEILDKTAFIVIIFSDQRPADARDSVANVDRNKGAMWNLQNSTYFCVRFGDAAIGVRRAA